MKNTGFVTSISHMSLGDTIASIAKTITEGGGERYLRVGDKVYQNERIVTSKGTCVEVDFTKGSGLLTCIYM